MRAIPSPTWRTVPTSARSVWTSYCSIRWRRIDVISSGRSFTASTLLSLHEFVSQSFQSAADARVDAQRAHVEDDAADEARLDLPRGVDLTAGRLLDFSKDRVRLG